MAKLGAPDKGAITMDLWNELAEGFDLSLRARGRSPRTAQSYMEGIGQFREHVDGKDPAKVTDRDVLEWLVSLRDIGRSPSTVSARYKALKAFFGWLESEGELVDANPMTKVQPPTVPETIGRYVTDDQVAALLRVCAGADFDDRRDTAILRVLLSTGIRRAELTGMQLDELDLREQSFPVRGKGDRIRTVSFGVKLADALSRYKRARARHPQASLPALWLSRRGHLTPIGLAHMLDRRCKEAGVEPVSPHAFRHRWAASNKSAGYPDAYLAELGGWRNMQVMNRYGRMVRAEQALEFARQHDPGDAL